MRSAGREGPSVAVVGAGGFLGRALVAALRESGVPTAELTRATPFVAAGGAPAPALTRADTVYYLASSINPAIAERDPAAVAAELRLFEELLGCLARLPRPPAVVLPSSGGTVYDVSQPPPYAETAPTRPNGRYGVAKLDMEERLRAAGLPGIVLRIGNVYGPGQPTGTGQGVIAHWLAAAARDEPIVVFGDPAASRDYVYVGDVAAALVAAADPALVATAPPVVNVGSGVPTSLADLVRLMGEVVGEVKVSYAGSRGFDVARTWLDVRLARDVLGWTARVPLEEGLRRTWQAGDRTRRAEG